MKNVLVALELFLVGLAGFVIYRRGACTMYVVELHAYPPEPTELLSVSAVLVVLFSAASRGI